MNNQTTTTSPMMGSRRMRFSQRQRLLLAFATERGLCAEPYGAHGILASEPLADVAVECYSRDDIAFLLLSLNSDNLL